MKAATVYLNDGTNYTTSINGPDAEIKKYFLNQWLNVGEGENDKMRKCIDVKIKPQGFDYNGMRIYFIDPHGKDISFNRWRAILYYAQNYAETVFFPSQKEYDEFLASQALLFNLSLRIFTTTDRIRVCRNRLNPLLLLPLSSLSQILPLRKDLDGGCR